MANERFHLSFRLDLAEGHPLAKVGYRRTDRGKTELALVSQFAAKHSIAIDRRWFERTHISLERLNGWLTILEEDVATDSLEVGDLWITEVSADAGTPLFQVVLKHQADSYLQKVGKYSILSTFDYPLVSPVS
jgi:hypothetical protein